MESVMMYLVKMLICSAVLFGYYRLALYNERFHQWNRFYLLTAMTLSVIVPFISIPVTVRQEADNLALIMYNLPWNAQAAHENSLFTWQRLSILASLLISIALLSKMVIAVSKVIMAYRSNPVTDLQQNVSLVITSIKEAPFSFFNWLFWRQDIDPASENGERILAHELTHIREMHSVDKVFASLLLCIFWMNPFFWLIQKELNTIHEFLADKKAIGHQDGTALAQMILQAIPLSPTKNNGLVNPFFSSQIKRRLQMITTSKNPKYSYMRRISGLAIMICSTLVLAITLQKAQAQTNKEVLAATTSDTPNPKITITKSTSTNSGYSTLADKTVDGKPAKKAIEIKLKSTERDGASPLIVLEGKEITSQEMNSIDPQTIESVSVFKGQAAIDKYGSQGNNGVVDIKLKVEGVEVENLKSKQNEITIEEKPVMVQGYKTKLDVTREKPDVIQFRKLKPTEIVVEGKPGAIGRIKIKPAESVVGKPLGVQAYKSKSVKNDNPLYYLNGVEISSDEMKQIKPNNIDRIDVLKGENATKKYGEKAKDGVIEITTKPIT